MLVLADVVNVCDVVADVVMFADDVVDVVDAAADAADVVVDAVVILAAVIFMVSEKKFLYLVSIATNKQTTITYQDICLTLCLPIQLPLIHEVVYEKVSENPILEKEVKWVYNVKKGL